MNNDKDNSEMNVHKRQLTQLFTNRKCQFLIALTLVALCVSGAVAPKGKNLTDAERAARRKAIIAPVAEGVLRVRPTFAACGVCYGSAKAVPGLALEWRKIDTPGGPRCCAAAIPSSTWQRLREFPHFDETGDYRGSILRLEEDTAYEVRVVADGTVRAQTSFRTWASEVQWRVPCGLTRRRRSP